MAKLHPLMNASVQYNLQKSKQAPSRGKIPNFTIWDSVLFAQGSFNASEKAALRWRGPRHVTKALSNIVFHV